MGASMTSRAWVIGDLLSVNVLSRSKTTARLIIVRCLPTTNRSTELLSCSFEEASGRVDFGAVGERCDCGRGLAGPLAGDASAAVPHEVDPQQWILVGVVQSCV